MGNLCEQHPVIRQALDQAQNKPIVFGDSMISSEYYQTEWPEDTTLQSKLETVKTDPQFKELFESDNLNKHKYLDRYYLGKWDERGVPAGKGVMLEPDSYIYYGDFNNQPEGQGVVELFKERIVYEGQIKEGKANGKGIVKSLDDKFTFEGVMKDSLPKDGTVNIPNQADPSKSCKIIFNDFPNQPTQIEYGDGRVYTGQVNKRTLAPEGKGKVVFADHSSYRGGWEDGQMQGEGEFLWKDGSAYKGEYQHGRKHGKGTFTFPSRNYYQGDWAEGKQHGKGVLYNENREVIKEGTWVNGIYQKQ